MLEVHPIFQTPIFVAELSGLTDDFGLDHYIRQLCEATPGNYGRGEVVQSSYNLNHDERCLALCEAIFALTYTITRDVYKYSSDYQVEITSMWGNMQRPGTAFQQHVHFNNAFSGVFYLNDHEDFPPILFHRPTETTMDPIRREFNVFNQGSFERKAKKDTLIIFPAWLSHSVGINQTDTDRLGISFNLMLRGDYYNNVL